MDVLECRLLLTSDFGDAPDSSSGTGPNDYQTLAKNGGPSHAIDATKNTLFLGGGVDSDAGTQQSLLANLDDKFSAGGRDDEDGVINPLDLHGTIAAAPTITLAATNITAKAATLFGWIDFNHNGVFENTTERAQVAVPSATANGKFTLTFPAFPPTAAGKTFARFRISTDIAAANPTGAASDGEVEDVPFVISNRIETPLQVTNSIRIGNRLNGGPSISTRDLFGIATENIGDLDGDGVTDLAVGVPYDDQGGTKRGAIEILFLDRTGAAKRTLKIAHNLNGGPSLTNEDHFGISITSLGDIDGDGVVDIAVGAAEDLESAHKKGTVYVIRLKTDGTAKAVTKISSNVNGGPTLAEGDSFSVVEAIGDLDGDGVVDVAVGSPDADAGFLNRGEIHLLNLKPDGSVKSFSKIQNTAAWNPSSRDEDNFGQEIINLGDLDGDGIAELAVESQTQDVAGSRPGLISILRLNADGTLKSATSLANGINGMPSFLADGAISGLEVIGDANGDGVNDLIFGVDEDSYGANGGGTIGALYLVNLNADGTVKQFNRLGSESNGAPAFLFPTLLVSSMSLLGDLNGDGTQELALGVPLYGNMNAPNGSLYVLSLKNVVPNTTVPATPVITGPDAVVSIFRPTFTWAESARASDYEIWLTNKSTGAIVMNTVPVSGTTYTPATDLGIGKYSLWVRAKNEVGPSPWSSRYDFVINTQLESIPVPDGMKRQPEFKWQSLAGAEKYEIWISKPETPTVALLNVKTTSAVTSFKPPTALAAGAYRFWVRGIAKDGTAGKWSVPDDFLVTPSTTVTKLSEQMGLRPKIEFTGIPGAVGYSIWINNLTTPWKPPVLATTSTTATLFQPETDLASGNHRIWVRGVAPDGTFGEWSPPKDFSAGVPPKFSTPSSTVSLQDTILLKWNEIQGATGYEMWQLGSGIQPQGLDLENVTQSNPIVPIRTQGTFRFFVRAIDASGLRGPWSAPIDMTVRDTVRGVKITTSPFANDRPVFSWTPMPNAKEYEIRIDDPIAGTTGKIVASKILTTTYTPTVRLPIGTYTFQVRGISYGGVVSEWSAPLSPATTQVPKLEDVRGTPKWGTELKWAAIEGATNYEVRVRVTAAPKKPSSIWEETTSVYYLSEPNTLGFTYLDGVYEWTVRAEGPDLPGLWCAPGTFEYDRRPVLTGETSFSSTQETKLIQWMPAEILNIRYEIWINSDRGTIVLQENVPAPADRFNLGSRLPAGNYRVWVRVLLHPEHYTAWSLPQNFSIT